MKRAFAVVAAIAMVFGALFIRGTFSSDGGGGGSGGGSGGSKSFTIACPPELSAPCRNAFGNRAVIEHAGTTLSRIKDKNVEVDAWLVGRSSAEVARADSGGMIESVTPTGARSPIVIAVWKDLQPALAKGCDAEFGLACLGEVGGGQLTGIPRVRIGFPDLTTMTGFDAVSAGTSAYYGTDDFPSNDFNEESGFLTWLRGFQNDASGKDELLNTMLTAGPAKFTAVVGTEASLRPIYEKAASKARVELLATPISSELVIVDFSGGPNASDAATEKDLLKALADAGWHIGKDSVSDLPPTDDTVELLDPRNDGMAVRDGVLAALRTVALANP